jgi:hypothetical protein
MTLKYKILNRVFHNKMDISRVKLNIELQRIWQHGKQNRYNGI